MLEIKSVNDSTQFSATASDDDLMIKLVKQLCIAAMVFSLTMLAIMLFGSNGSSEVVSSKTVVGIVSVGKKISGQVSLKDASVPSQERYATIGANGTFVIDITGMKAPFVLQANGSAAGEKYKLLSFAKGAGTANINPLSDVIVASAAGDDDPENVYEHADVDQMIRIKDNFGRIATILMEKLQPVLTPYHAENVHPITSSFHVTYRVLDNLFEHVLITVKETTVSVLNRKSGKVMFSAMLNDIAKGTVKGAALLPPFVAPAPPIALASAGGRGLVALSRNTACCSLV